MANSLNLLGNLGEKSTFRVNTVYLFGAGASANAIPIMKNLRLRVIQLMDWIEKILNNKDFYKEIAKENIELINKIREDFLWLTFESKHFDSFDTLAKKYSLLNNSNGYFSLVRLKKILCVYFFFEQWVKIPKNRIHDMEYNIVDLRYDSLIAALLENIKGEIRIKNDVKFVTWNYDLQFEKTLIKYSHTNNFNSLKKDFFIIPNKTTLHDRKTSYTFDNVASIVKLNGNAFLDENLNTTDSTSTLYDIKDEYDTFGEAVESLIKTYSKMFPKGEGSHESLKYFNYSWERNDKTKFAYETINNTIEEAKRSFSTAHTIIIIGYSFPYVNREIDKEILSKSYPSKIIIQDLQPDIIFKRLLCVVNTDIRQKLNNKSIEVVFEEASNYFPTPD